MKQQLDIYTFGRLLIETGDLDPIYVMLHTAMDMGVFSDEKFRHWLLAYWCFYHSGTASWIADSRDFWKAMETAAGSKEYPRGSERRHFRAANATSSVAWLKSKSQSYLFEGLVHCDTFEEVSYFVQKWVGFGPWIAFKVADMVERLGIRSIEFRPTDIFSIFDSPAKGASLLKDWEEPQWEPDDQNEVNEWALNRVLSELGELKAPPRYDRPINVQEVETILCKWKSYLGGHYHVGKDVAELRPALLRFAKCKTSQRLLKAARAGGLGA